MVMMRHRYLVACFEVLLTIAVIEGSFLCPLCCDCGDVLPTDPYILTTQRLILYCKVTNEAVTRNGLNASDLEFSRDNIVVSQNYTTIVNQTTLMLNMTIHSLQQKGTYYCQVKEGERHKLDSENKYHVERQVVTVENYPQKIPEDTVKCVVFDWDVNLTCSWVPNGRYLRPHDIQTKVYWNTYPCHQDDYKTCNNINDNKCTFNGSEATLNDGYSWCFAFEEIVTQHDSITDGNNNSAHTLWDITWKNFIKYQQCQSILNNSCTVKSRDGKEHVSIGVGSWDFKFEVTNTRANVTVTSTYNFSDLNIVKPSKVTDFNATAINSTCIKLDWAHSHTRKERRKFFEISYQSKWDDSPQRFNTSVNVYTTTICDLIPHTTYSFTIGCYPEVKGYRSDLVAVSNETLQDVPAIPPRVSNGSFISHLDDCRSEVKDRNVTVYWKNIPEKDQNGRLTAFRVQYEEDDSKMITHTVIPPKTWTEIELACDKSYNVRIMAGTAIGFSKASTIHVLGSSYKGISPPLEVIPVLEVYNTSVTTTVINVSWTPPDTTMKNIEGFTVYWCHHSSIGICDSEIEWRHVEANESSTNILFESFQRNTLFGVSMETDKGSSGFKWEHCIYKKDAEPKPPVITFGQSPPENGLTVTWTVDRCDSSKRIESPYIIGYIVGYCEADHSTKTCISVVKDSELVPFSSVPRYDVRHLQAGKSYGVSIKSVSWNGEGQYSDFIFDIPKNNDLSGGTIAGISIAAVIILALAIAGLIFCVRYMKKKTAAMRRPYDIEVPEIPESHVKQNDAVKLNGYVIAPSSPRESDHLLLRNGLMENGNITRQISRDSGHESLNSDTLNIPQTDQPSSINRINDQILNTVREESEHSSGGIDLTSRQTEESTLSYRPHIGQIYSKVAVVLSDTQSEESSLIQSSGHLLSEGHENPTFTQSVAPPNTSPPQEKVFTVAHLTSVQLDRNPLLEFQPLNLNSGSANETLTTDTEDQMNETYATGSVNQSTDGTYIRRPTSQNEDGFDSSEMSSAPSYMKADLIENSPNPQVILVSKNDTDNTNANSSYIGNVQVDADVNGVSAGSVINYIEVEGMQSSFQDSSFGKIEDSNGDIPSGQVSDYVKNGGIDNLAADISDCDDRMAEDGGESDDGSVGGGGESDDCSVSDGGESDDCSVSDGGESDDGSVSEYIKNDKQNLDVETKLDGYVPRLEIQQESSTVDESTNMAVSRCPSYRDSSVSEMECIEVPFNEDRSRLPINASTVSLTGSLYIDEEIAAAQGKNECIAVPQNETTVKLPVNSCSVSSAGPSNDENVKSTHSEQAIDEETLRYIPVPQTDIIADISTIASSGSVYNYDPNESLQSSTVSSKLIASKENKDQARSDYVTNLSNDIEPQYGGESSINDAGYICKDLEMTDQSSDVGYVCKDFEMSNQSSDVGYVCNNLEIKDQSFTERMDGYVTNIY